MAIPNKSAREMSLAELKNAEYIESCCDDGYGKRLRELREELIRRKQEGDDCHQRPMVSAIFSLRQLYGP
jgi:hypothetical protein